MKIPFLILLLFYIKIISKILFENKNDESECPQRKFGINCTEECDEKCDYSKQKNCDKVTGECICISKYYYDKSEKKCNICPSNCETCNSNIKCETCENKTNYGDLCDKICDKCMEKDGIYCDINGKCVGECIEGYKGDYCNEKCDQFCKVCLKNGECITCISDDYYLKDGKCEKCWDGCDKCNSTKCIDCKLKDKFGDYCNYSCSKNCFNDNKDQVCDRNSGLCNKCKEHFTGPNCTECEGHFKLPDCNQCEGHFKLPNCTECEGHFKLPDCNECEGHFTGPNCTECEGHFKLPNCTECEGHFTGPNCTECEGHFKLPDCTKCVQNFTGENCSECIKNKTGINCDIFCPQNCDLNLGNCYRNGTCRGCINGFKGEKCNDSCVSNCLKCDQYNNTCYECKKLFWGENCEKDCAKHCLNQKCSKDNGTCKCETNFVQKEGCNECIPNYTGEDCNENCFKGCDLRKGNCDRYTKECICQKGFYLRNCSMKCSKNCLGEICNNITGYCFQCKDKFYGNFCEYECPNNCIKCNRENGECITCEKNYYLKDEKCIECSNDCLNKTCNNITGECDKCKDNHRYGKFCEEKCPENCLEKESEPICNRTTGTCEDCKEFFRGPNCSNCIEKHYNLSTCQENCSNYCSNNLCNDETGKCDECVKSRYGDFCEKICQNCTDNGCTRVEGYCIQCDNNFYREGNICDKCPDNCESCTDGKCDNCKEGFKGEKCHLTCDTGCERSCDKLNGECSNCKNGYYGKYCNLTCDGCHEICIQENGECVDHLCKDQYYNSDKCDKNCSDKCKNNECDLYTGECIYCDNYNWGKECEKYCNNDECYDVDCCFIKSDDAKKKSFELDINNKESDDYDFITLYIGKDSIPMKILVDYTSRAPLMIFDNQTTLDFYQSEEREKINIDKKYNRNLNQNESNSIYKIKKVKYSYLECDGFMINDSISLYKNQKFNIFFFIPNKIDIDDDTDLSSISISGVVGLNFLSIFTESLVINNIISKNLFIKINDKFLFGDFSEEIKKDNFKTTTILKPDLTKYKLDTKNEFYAELSGFAVSNRKAYKYTLDKKIIFKLKGDSEIVLSTSFIIFFEKIYFNNYIKNNTCSLTDLNIKEFICKSVNNLPKLGIIIQNYTYYLNTSFLFKKIGDRYKFIIKFDKSEQKMILGKDFFNQYQVVYNNGRQILNFYGDTKKVNIMLNNLPIIKDSYDSYLSPGLKSIIIIYSIVGLITFFYILKYCFSEDSDFEYDYDDDDDIDSIFEED